MYHSFDTLDVAKSFIKGGMKTELAETVARAIAISRDADLSYLATKADLKEVESKLEKQILKVESRLETKILEVENRLEGKILSLQGFMFTALEKSKNETLKWVVGMNIATISAVAALLKFFIN